MEPTKQGTSTRVNTFARPRFCRAVYRFQQAHPDELSLSVGDVVQVLGEEEPGWWRGRIGNRTGVFPSCYVEPIDSSDAPPVLPAQPATSSSLKEKPGNPSKNITTPNKSPSSLSRKKFKSSDSSGHSTQLLQCDTENSFLLARLPHIQGNVFTRLCAMKPTKKRTSTRGNTDACPRFFRAVNNFQQAGPDELSLSVGDVVQVLGEVEPGWWRGRIGNRTGVFPSRRVEPIDSSDAPTVLPAQPGTSGSLKEKPGNPSKNTVTPNKSPSFLSRKKFKSSDSSPTVQATEVWGQDSLEYERTQGTGIEGTTYHLRLLAVHLLNAIDTLPKFLLGAEVSQRIAGKFDDICLIYIDAVINKQKSLLIQVKHKENKNIKISEQALTSVKGKNDFSITSYFHSYLKYDTTSTIYQLGEIDALVLYTNATSNILNHEVVDVTSSVNPLLRINNMPGKFYRFTEKFMLKLKDQFMKFTLEKVAKKIFEYLQRGGEDNDYVADTSYNKIVSSFMDAAFKMNENNEIRDLNEDFCEATGIWSEGPGKLFRNMLIKSIPLKTLDDHLKKHTRCLIIHRRNIHKLDLLGDILDKDIEKFAQLFILATNQPSIEELEIVIKDKLAQNKVLNSVNVNKIVYGSFMDQITTWYRQAKPVFMNNDEILSKIRLYVTSQQLIRNPVGLVFSEKCLETLRQLILSCKERVLHVTTGSHREFVVLKITKALESKEDVLLFDAISFSKLDDTTFNKIILICLDRDEDLHKLDSLKYKKFSKLIVLQDVNSEVICNFFSPTQVLHLNVDVTFADLSEDSKEIFTSKECITFQGNSISVKELMAKLEIEESEVLDVALNHYCSDNSISIGDSMGNDSDLLPKIISDLDIEISSDQLEELLMRKNIFVLFDIFDDKSMTIERLSNILNKSISDIENMQNANFEHEKDFNVFLRSPKAPKNKIIYFVRTNTDNCLKIKKAYNPNLYIERELVFRQTVLVTPLKLFEALREMSLDIAVIISNIENLDFFLEELLLSDVNVEQLVEDGRLFLVEGPDGRGAFLAKTKRFETVHWFEKKSSIFVWRCTDGGLDFVRDTMKSKTFHSNLDIHKYTHTPLQLVYLLQKILSESLRKMSPDIAVVISTEENLEQFSKELRLFVNVEQLVEDGRLNLVKETDGREAFLAKKARFKTVHWFEKTRFNFVWRCTEGDLDFVRDDIKHVRKDHSDTFSISVDNDIEQNSSEYKEKGFAEISWKELNFVDKINQKSEENRIVVISDDPGKGKSTSLSTFSRHYMELGSYLVIRVNFKEHSFRKGLVKLHTQTLTTASIIELLSSINRLNINNPLGRHLLTVCLRNKERALNKLIFMLDGFDEVPPKIMEKAKILIRFLKEETQSTVFVTTRKHYTTTLEDLCSVFSTRFRKLTEESIVLYIKEFFAAHPKQSIIDNQNYGIKDSRNFQTYLRNNIEILNFPLHLNITCNILLSNIKQNSVNDFDSFVYPSAFSLLKEYIKIKVESCGEKSDLPLQTYSDPDVFVKQCHEFLGKLALTEIFPELQISGDVVAELAGVKHRFLLLGIVQEDFYSGFTAQEKESSKFTFIHRTFCEYYCADFIFNNISNQKYKDMLMPVLDEIIEGKLDKEYSMLKTFLNSFFTEPFPILNAINNGSGLDHACLLYDENVKDLLGRTPLHYAAMNRDEFTIHELLDNGWVHTVDITGRLPLHYHIPGSSLSSQSFYHLSPFSSPIRFFNRNIINSWSSVRSRIRPCFYNGKNLREYNRNFFYYWSSVRSRIRPDFYKETNLLEDITSNENTPLIIFVKTGNLPLLKYLCDSDNTNINEPNNEGKTPLHVAAELWRYNMVRCLVGRGGDVNSRDAESKTPLDYAMQIYTYTEYINCVKFLFLECGATTTAMSSRDSQVLRDVLTADVNGNNLDSLLTEPFVSQHRHLRVYLQFLGARESLLLAVGCAIPDYSEQILNAVNPRFLISTEYICKTIKRSEAEDILKSILQCTNTPNCDLTGDTWEYSPLHFLAYIGDMYQIESLLEKGAKYNVVNRNGHTPAQVYRNHHHRDCRSLRVVEELFKCCNNDDSTLPKENFEQYTLVRDSRGRTLLHTALEAGCMDLVKGIIDITNGDTRLLNATDDNRETALHYAAKMGYEDFALQLLYRGADSMCRDRDGRLPADLLRTESTIKYIWRQLCKLFDYYSNGYSDEDEAMSIIDGIQSQGEIPHYLMNIRDGDYNMLLGYAVRNGHLRVVIFILSNGGSYEIYLSHKIPIYEISRLFEFLSYAFDGTFFDLVRMLEYADTEDSVKKCILNARNYRGDTLLHCVKNKDLAKWLVTNCEDINIKDVGGKTPLQRAEERNDSDIRTIIKNEVDRRLAGPSSITY